MIKIYINGNPALVKENINLFDTLRYTGFITSRFCFHSNLNVSGSCRACLVEIQNMEKPIAACVTDLEPNLSVWTNSPFVQKAKENVLEILLRNHPLDCPICDQAGECDLQDQSKKFGGLFTRFFFQKRSVTDKNCGFFIKTVMTRCIHCTRCVRFNEMNGNETLGLLNRGQLSEIGTYSFKESNFELLSNIIDLCPVGALTSRTYSFQNRPWELKIAECLDLTDGICANIYINYRDTEIYKITPKPNNLLNGNIITDKCRFSYDALTENRLKKIYHYDNLKCAYKSITWFSFLNKIKILNKNEFLHVFITEELDLINIEFIKKLSNKYCNKLKVSLFTKINSNCNLYVYNLTATLKDIEKDNRTCILLSTNTKIECSILNFKLKLKYKKKILSVFCFGRFFNNNLQIKFIALNLNNFLFFWESKLTKISAMFINLLFPLILIGESFSKRVFDRNFSLIFFKTLLPRSILLNINLFSNEKGGIYLNSKNNFTKKGFMTFICINLNDSLLSRKYLLTSEKRIFWLNTHRPYSQIFVDYLVPISTYMETENLYMNLEQQIQKNQKIFSSFYESKPLKVVLEAFFNLTPEFILKKSKSFLFLIELTKTKHQLYKLTIKFNFFFNFLKKRHILISNYPLRGLLEDYYFSNNFTRNSLLLSNYQHYIINSKKNF